MNRENNVSSIIDAFVALRDVDDDDVKDMIKPGEKTITEGKSFSINNNVDMDEAEQYRNADRETDNDITLEIVDPKATSFDELQSKAGYVGSQVLICNKCGSGMFMPYDKLVQSEDDSDVYNLDTECPTCHLSGYGFTKGGMVVKVQDAEKINNEEEAPRIDNDQMQSEEAMLDNNLPAEERESSSQGPEQVEEPEQQSENASGNQSEEEEDSFEANDEENDGMETDVADDDDEVEKSLGDEVDTDDDLEEDDDDSVKESLNLREGMNKYAREAWMMNQVLSHMNDEDAYYSGWLYIWPDGETEEDCAYDFGNEEDLEDLRKSFIRYYKDCHAAGLYGADDETVDFAHEQDMLLGLKPIRVIEDRPKQTAVREALECPVVNEFLKSIIDPENIEKVIVEDISGEQPRNIYMGSLEELPDNIGPSNFDSFNVDKGRLTCNIDSNDIECPTKLGAILNHFNDEGSDRVDVWDNACGDEVFHGRKQDAIDQFGNCGFFGFETPVVLKIKVNNPALISCNDYEDQAQLTDIDRLIKHILKANDLSENRIHNMASNEYWINECIRDKEDLEMIYESFVYPTNDKQLIREFKSLTDFRDELDDALSKYGKELKDLEEDPLTNAPLKEDIHDDSSVDDHDDESINLADCDDDCLDALYDKLVNDDYIPEQIEYSEVPIIFTYETSPATREEPADYDEGEITVDYDYIIDRDDMDFVRDFILDHADGNEVLTYRQIKDIFDRNSFEDAAYDYFKDAAEQDAQDKADEGGYEDEINDYLYSGDYDESLNDQCDHEAVKTTSYKTRKELSEAIEECRNNNQPYIISRSQKEGYRYDLTINNKVDEAQLPVRSHGERVSGQVMNRIDHNENNQLVDVNLSDKDREVLNKICDISKDISDAIKKYYKIDADPRLIVADMIQDLRLISGMVNVRDLADTPMNNLTREMFNSYNQFYEATDQIMSMLTGEDFHTSAEDKLDQAFAALNSSAFSKEAIYKGIGSRRFLSAVEHGQIPYLQANDVPRLTEALDELQIDNEESDDELAEEAPIFNEDNGTFETAKAVMASYQNANKWLDTVKESIYTEMNCPFFSSYVHTLAHTMPGRFDQFGDILHTVNMEIPYPETMELSEKPRTIVEAFDVIFKTLDGIKEALNVFIKDTDEAYHGMSCAAEALLNDIESEYPMLYRLQAKAVECGDDTVTFDKFVGQYVDHKDSLLESLDQADVCPKCGKPIGECTCAQESLDEAKKDEVTDKVLDNLEKIETQVDLIRDSIDSAESYDDAIKEFENSDIKDKEEIISKLHHIKGEELKHIDELEATADLLPEMGKLADEPDAVEEPEVEVAEEPLEQISEIPQDESLQEIDFNEAQFDEELNQYFNEAYEDTVIYNTESGTVDHAGNIMLEGMLMMNEKEYPITFTLTPEKALNEDLNSDELKQALKDQTFRVTNNLSEEVFEFNFQK